MHILALRLVKLMIIAVYKMSVIIYFLSGEKKSFVLQALIVGNYNHIPVDQKLLLDTLEKEDIKCRFVYTTEKSGFLRKFGAYLRLAGLLHRAENVIVFDYCFPLYCIPKKAGQKHIQMWHANGAFKRFGLPNFYKKYSDELGKYLYKIVPIHSTYDHIFVSNKKCIPYYMEAFGIPENEKYMVCNNIILNMITDYRGRKLSEKRKNNIEVIYAPTYNYEAEEDLYSELANELHALGEKRGINIKVTAMLHPKLHPEYNKMEALVNADILVTDYSSVCFEAEGAGVKVAFLRSENLLSDVFIDVAEKVYTSPKELAKDIADNNIPDNHYLSEFLCDDEEKSQITELLKIIRRSGSVK